MIYNYISVIVCIVFAFIEYSIEGKKIYNPVTIFCGLWAIIMFFSSLQLYTIKAASDEYNKMILIGILMYLIGFYIYKIIFSKVKIKNQYNLKNKEDVQIKLIPRYRLIYILGCVCLIYSVYSLISVIIQAGGINLGEIQRMLQSGEYESHNNALINALSFLVISPVKFVIPAITAVDFWFGKRDKKLFCITICLILTSMLSSANRTTFLLFFVWLILVAAIKYNFDKKNRNDDNFKYYKKSLNMIRKNIKLFIVITIIAFFIMTLSRGVTMIFRQVYLYFSMSPRMFEIWANKVELADIHTNGMSSLLGFFYPVFYFFKNIFGLEGIPKVIQTAYDWNMLTDTLWVSPGDKIFANAYVSIFWFLYIDGRLFGIIFGMYIIGYIVSKSYFKTISLKYTQKQITIFCIWFYVILFSFVRFQFSLPKIALGLLYINFCLYKRDSY